MLSKQTLFASNSDETVTDDDASSCKRQWQDAASKEVAAYVKEFLILTTCFLHTRHICASARHFFKWDLKFAKVLLADSLQQRGTG